MNGEPARDGAPDTRAEFDAHLEAAAAELEEQGLSRARAWKEALRRFGDIDQHLRACERQQLDAGRRWKGRVSLAFGALACAAIIALAAVVAHLAGRLRALDERVQAMATGVLEVQQEHRTPESPGVVYIDGECRRPGVYSLPPMGELTVSRLIAASGGGPAANGWVSVRRQRGQPASWKLWRSSNLAIWEQDGEAWVAMNLTQPGNSVPLDVPLVPGDVVTITQAAPAPPPGWSRLGASH